MTPTRPCALAGSRVGSRTDGPAPQVGQVLATGRLGSEAARFLVVGGIATLVSLTIFNALVHGFLTSSGPMAQDPLVAYVIANSVGMLVSWQGTRAWAFRRRRAAGPGGGFPAFVAINLATMTIPMACLAVSRYALGLSDPLADNLAANVIGLALGMATRFWVLRRAVFRAV